MVFQEAQIQPFLRIGSSIWRPLGIPPKMRDTVSGTDLRPTFQPNPFSIFGRDETQTDRQTYRQNDRQTADLISQLTMGEIKMITIKIITEVSIAARASFTFYFIFFS